MPDVKKESVESIENLPPRREESHTHTYAHTYTHGDLFFSRLLLMFNYARTIC